MEKLVYGYTIRSCYDYDSGATYYDVTNDYDVFVTELWGVGDIDDYDDDELLELIESNLE